MSPWVNDERFKKYNKIWKKVEKLMRIDFESKNENKNTCRQYN